MINYIANEPLKRIFLLFYERLDYWLHMNLVTRKRFCKILALVGTFVLALMFLSACQSSPTAGPRPSTTETSAISSTSQSTSAPTLRPTLAPTVTPSSNLGVEPAELNGISLQFWHTWSGDTERAVRELVGTFNVENEWGIRVNLVRQESLDELSNQLETALKNGDAPDLVTGYVYQAQEWDSSNKVVDLANYVNDPIWGFNSRLQDDFYPAFWDQQVASGKRYGIPAPGAGQMLFYNLTWAKAMGFNTPPTTPKQFEQQACAAAQANMQDNNPDNDHTGGLIISSDYSAILGWIGAYGGDVVNPQGNGYQFNTSQTKDVFTFLRGLYDEGCAWLPTDDAPDTDFAARKGLFATGSVTDIPYLEEAFGRQPNQDQWTAIPFPSPVSQPVIAVYAPAYVMLASTPQKQLATWLFIKWLALPENQAAIVRSSSSFPVSSSTLEALSSYQKSHSKWSAAVDLLSEARPEPTFQSWATVRWALHDAATQLFRSYFTIDQVPNLTKLLNETAADLQSGSSQ